MRKFLLLAATAICAVSLNAKTIYLNTGGGELWNQANAVFFAHSWASETDNADVQLTNVSGDIFSAEINDAHGNILFVRMPEGASSVIWDGEGKFWNKTADLTIPEGQNQYNITGWGDNDGNWSTYGGGSGENPGGGTGEMDHMWYYKGYIDGKDVEPGDATLFHNGTVEFACSEKSYLMILYQVHGVPGVQYMTESYVEGVTHAKLTTTGSEKMAVEPGMYTLYLYDNGDGSVELSTEPLPGKTLVDAEQGGGEDPGEQAIENVYELNLSAPMFDLLGRQVTEEYHGIVIQNGHKFVR